MTSVKGIKDLTDNNWTGESETESLAIQKIRFALIFVVNEKYVFVEGKLIFDLKFFNQFVLDYDSKEETMINKIIKTGFKWFKPKR